MKKPISDIIREAFQSGDYTGWFETAYRNGKPPWAKLDAHPHLKAWIEREQPATKGKRAIVVGCGLGDDAEYLAQQGYQVVAFDVSETAIEQCKERFPNSAVEYVTMDLFNAPDAWHGTFDFVFESRTIQALPYTIADKTMHAIANFLTDDAILLVLCHGRLEHETKQGIPWSLSHDDLQPLRDIGLHEANFETLMENGNRYFRVTYHKPS